MFTFGSHRQLLITTFQNFCLVGQLNSDLSSLRISPSFPNRQNYSKIKNKCQNVNRVIMIIRWPCSRNVKVDIINYETYKSGVFVQTLRKPSLRMFFINTSKSLIFIAIRKNCNYETYDERK